MRILVTADLHYNHPKSRQLAEELIDQMNVVEAEVLLLIGDTATSDGDALEACLSRFRFAGPKLLVAGNHELWTRGEDSYGLFRRELPRRVRELGWHWLQADPFRRGAVAIVGNIGWYDYSFASADLAIPRRFYENKVSPGAAEHFGMTHLLNDRSDFPETLMELYARWNDGKFVKLGRSDEDFLSENLADLESQLAACADAERVIVAVHHLPFRELLPPVHRAQWEFAKAYLGAEQIGAALQRYGNVKMVLCGHSHFSAEAQVSRIHAINLGSGYRKKQYRVIEI